ncbi:transporter [Dactylosporangium sp. CA-139066]|uniref:transporter n=1 Tax=Dactylosporangium sp. CA-139066 TaxID=3239930 RepID=UPI003D93E57E
MIWLTWRQHRREALFTLLALAALAAFTIPTGVAMHRAFDRDVAGCLRALGAGVLVPLRGSCQQPASAFADQYAGYRVVAPLLLFAPAVIGLFWGAPLLARELEQQTHRLVWTQGVGRLRWAATKFGLVLGFAALVAAACAALLSWWLRPLATALGDRFEFPVFDLGGPAAVAYTLFAVALGIAAGADRRKVLPAMGVLLAVFLAARIGVTVFARPGYLPAEEATVAATSPEHFNRLGGGWVLDQAVRAPDGRVIHPNAEQRCDPDHPAEECDRGAVNWVRYQPAQRYWTFQAIESGVFLLGAAGLVLVALRRTGRLA